MNEQINMRCPSCNGGFLFIGAGGYLTCGFVGCPNPDVEAQVAALKRENILIRDHLTIRQERIVDTLLKEEEQEDE